MSPGRSGRDRAGSSAGPALATSERAAVYLWRTAGGRSVKVSATAYFLLAQESAGHSLPQIAARLSDRLGQDITLEQTEAALTTVRDRIAYVDGRTRPAKPLGLWWHARILPPRATIAVAHRLAVAFHPVIVLLLCGFLAYVVVRDHEAVLSAGPGGIMTRPDVFWPGIGLVAVSLLFHEFGHVSAAARYGVRADTVGIGVYWLYPVAFSDVSTAWALPRRKRLVVDLAGFYFQLVVAAAYLELYRITGWDPARYAAVGIATVIAFMLFPFLKYDGYWLLSDLLGVANLHRSARRAIVTAGRTLRPRRLRRSDKAPAVPLPWPRRITTALTLYAVVAGLALGEIFVGMAATLVHLVRTYPARVAGLVRDISLPPHHPATGRLQSLFISSYVLFGLVMGLLAFSLRGWRALRAAHRLSRGNP